MKKSEDTIKLAGCIIQNEAGEILLLHRNTADRVQWELPGGKIEMGESSGVAAEREVLEELGISLGNLQFFGSDLFVEGDKNYSYHWFLARIIDGIPTPFEKKFDRAAYFPIDDLPKLTLSSNMKRLLPHLQLRIAIQRKG